MKFILLVDWYAQKWIRLWTRLTHTVSCAPVMSLMIRLRTDFHFYLGYLFNIVYKDLTMALTFFGTFQLAQKELQKMNMYKAPRDKLVCILNCCKVINNLLINASIASSDNPPGADEFLPVLIYVTIKVGSTDPIFPVVHSLFFICYICLERDRESNIMPFLCNYIPFVYLNSTGRKNVSEYRGHLSLVTNNFTYEFLITVREIIVLISSIPFFGKKMFYFCAFNLLRVKEKEKGSVKGSSLPTLMARFCFF